MVSHGGSLVEELERSGSKHYVLPVHEKSLWTVLQSIRALRQIIQKEKIDIVHARSRIPAWIAYFACRQTAATLVTTCHGYYSGHWISRVMGWPKLVIVPSEVIGRHMIEQFGVSAKHIRLIPRSVDLEKFNIPREDQPGRSQYIISIVGRLTSLKGHTYFLRAMAKVVRTMPFVRIWIIGDAPPKKEAYKHELELLVQRLGLTDSVEFLGNRKDIPQLLASTNVLVLSTVTQEAFGRVILEAQAAGVPVVATKVGGVVEIIDDEETGLLVLPKDIDAMAQAVIRLLNDKPLAAKLVSQAKKKLEQSFTLERMAGQTLKVYEELLGSLNILVIKLSALGDVILITASLKALREKYPKARIYCLVGQEFKEILQRCPYLDGMILFDAKEKHHGWWKLFRLGRKLRKYRFDIVVDFQNNRKSHWLSFLSFPRESYGYRNSKFGFLVSNPVKNPNHQLPPVEHQFQILQMLGIPYRENCFLELWPSAQDKKHVDGLLDAEWLGNASNIVGINLAASAKWETKNWPLEYVARLCDYLASQNIRVILTGMEKDKEKARKVLHLAKSKPADLTGKTNVLQLASLIQRCRVYVTPDSAPLHLAAAMRTPFVALFGPTTALRHLPPAQHSRVIEKKPSCAPCYSSTCRVKTHVCMKEIMPDEVAENIKALLEP
ncbi:MAG: lipopolysaccharide heptosyltransferase II [Omnitrophica WOR_2 bacterium RIFCSPHIGHO2_01_FULL_48_9]|nr:MAG: lipopolysaccharide heptosyltransferase II [Omnitrophica WOR_2 bacterium RIFCSPHIGHO2_01_FULL_48_9]